MSSTPRWARRSTRSATPRRAKDNHVASARFDQHRGIAPILWVFASLALLELLVVHLVMASRWPSLAWPMTLVTGASVVWLVAWTRSFKRRPHELDDDRLRLHFGSLRSIDIPLHSLRAVRTSWDGVDLKRPGTINFVPVAYPNRMVEIDPPIAGRKRSISAVAFRVDDPTAFDAAIVERGIAII